MTIYCLNCHTSSLFNNNLLFDTFIHPRFLIIIYCFPLSYILFVHRRYNDRNVLQPSNGERTHAWLSRHGSVGALLRLLDRSVPRMLRGPAVESVYSFRRHQVDRRLQPRPKVEVILTRSYSNMVLDFVV